MIGLLHKAMNSLRRDGLRKTLSRTRRWSFNRWPLSLVKERRFRTEVLALDDAQARFTAIYTKNTWGNDESASGWGSTLAYTAPLRAKLPELFQRYQVGTVFDAPCGDFNWFRHVLKDNPLTYIGGDIVAPMIERLNGQYGDSRIHFVHIDLIAQPFPKADLMICRDCLFHLSFRDTRAVLANFVASGIPYLLTTTYANDDGQLRNRDIETGDFRYIDLFSPPYGLPRDVGFRVNDFQPPEPRREMCLWTREQVELALGQFNPGAGTDRE